MHSNISDDQNSNDVSDFVYNGTDMLINSINDNKIAQLAAAGPAGMAAAAAIASCHKGKNNFEFESNPALRKRIQTRLLRKLKITLNEYSIRIGQQAAIVLYKPSKPPSTNSLKIFGSQPLEDVLNSWSLALISDIEKAFPLVSSRQRSQFESQTSLPHLYELPPLKIDGIPTSLDQMTQGQLRGFIPHMLKFATGRGKPGWGRQNMMPVWWPKHIPWANVRADIRSDEQKQKVSWTEALKEIILNCYSYYGRTDLIESANGKHDLLRHNPPTSNSTTSYLDVGPGEGNDFSLLTSSSVVNIVDQELESSNCPEDYLLNQHELMAPNCSLASNYRLLDKDNNYLVVSTFDSAIKLSNKMSRVGHMKMESLKKSKHLLQNVNDAPEDIILDLSSLTPTSESCFGNRNKRSKTEFIQYRKQNNGKELKAPMTSLQHELAIDCSSSSLYTSFIGSRTRNCTSNEADQNKGDKDPSIPDKMTEMLSQSNQTLCALITDKYRVNQMLMQKIPFGNNHLINRCTAADDLRQLLPTNNDNFSGQLQDMEANVVGLPISAAINNQDVKHDLNSGMNSLVGRGYGINELSNMSMVVKVNTINTIDGSLSIIPFTFINTNLEANGNDDPKLSPEIISLPFHSASSLCASSKLNEAQPPHYMSNVNHLLLNNLFVLDGEGTPYTISNIDDTDTSVPSPKNESDSKVTQVSCVIQNMDDYDFAASQNPSDEDQANQQKHQLKCDEFVEAL